VTTFYLRHAVPLERGAESHKPDLSLSNVVKWLIMHYSHQVKTFLFLFWRIHPIGLRFQKG